MAYADKGGSRSSFTTCGIASVQVMPFDSIRKQAIFVNDSANDIYLSKGPSPAVAGSGIRLNALGGSWVLEPDTYGRIWTGAIQAIAGGAASNLSWTEDW